MFIWQPSGRHRRDGSPTGAVNGGGFGAPSRKKLARAEAELDLDRAAELAEAAPSCLLCYEADWQVCHRRRVAEILAERRHFGIHHLANIAGTGR